MATIVTGFTEDEMEQKLFTMEQVITLIDALMTWPLVILVFMLCFKKKISLLLERLGEIGKIKYKDAEIEFSKPLEQTKQDLREQSSFEPGLIAEDPNLAALIETSPTLAVSEAWKSIEVSARKKVEQLIPPEETFRSPLDRPINYLESKGALIPSTASALRGLRVLRNRAVQIKDAAVSREDAIQYVELAIPIQRQIDAITDLPEVKLTALTLLVLDLNSLIDSGKFNDITVDEVYQWAEERKILACLAERTRGEFSSENYNEDGPYANFSNFYNDQMESLANATVGSKFGVENSGLCLLLAWTNELIQQGAGWYPR